jgi:two-component system catabolic regulation response regulator CreB
MAGQGAKIVVGDSDRAVLELIQIRLDLAGYHACVARDGPSLMEVLKNVRPAALVLDMTLAGLNGFEVLQTLSDRGGVTYPILFMGRNLAADDVRRALKFGVGDCMAKPFSGADILERVARLLRTPARAMPHTVNV